MTTYCLQRKSHDFGRFLPSSLTEGKFWPLLLLNFFQQPHLFLVICQLKETCFSCQQQWVLNTYNLSSCLQDKLTEKYFNIFLTTQNNITQWLTAILITNMFLSIRRAKIKVALSLKFIWRKVDSQQYLHLVFSLLTQFLAT